MSNPTRMLEPISFQAFEKLAANANVVPVVASLYADLMTPVGAFMRLCREGEVGFLLESVEGGERFARYSFLGHRPREVLTFDGGTVACQDAQGVRSVGENIFHELRQRVRPLRVATPPGLPRFSGGFVGYFGYDVVRLLERLPARLPPLAHPPIARLGLYDTVLAFDHLRHQIHIIANAFVEEADTLRQAYDLALERLHATRQSLATPLASPSAHIQAATVQPIQSNFDRAAFCAAVQRAKAYIRAGDIFQVVLSQQFAQPVSARPFDVYRALRFINPSPYLYFLQFPDQAVIGSSPEMLVRVEQGEATVRPIAGTRPRGKSPENDLRLEAELLADEKERAEHVMLVDLGRNDLGRIATYGGVRVTERMVVERYSHVMHIVSEVRANVRPGLDAIDVLCACFPAGTVSGAPKIRAMEIIEELEPARRGLYAGALGYFDFSGNLDTCITIRTIEIRDGVAYFQAGAGIVADSDPVREYDETVHKSNALRSAIALAETGLPAI